MEVKLLQELDKALFDDWLAKRGRPILDVSVLPDTGFMAWDNGKPIACTFLYQTDSKSGLMGWTTTNPDLEIPMRVKFKAVKMLTNAAQDKCKEWGLKLLFYFSSAHGLTRILEREGFKVSSMSHDLCLWGVQDGN